MGSPKIHVPAPPPAPKLPELPPMPQLKVPELNLPDINIAAPKIDMSAVNAVPQFEGVEYDDSEFDMKAPTMGTRDQNRVDAGDLRVNNQNKSKKTTKKKSKAVNTAVNQSSGLFIDF